MHQHTSSFKHDLIIIFPSISVPCIDNDSDCPGLGDLCGRNSYVDKYCLKTCPEACKKLNSGDGDGESEGNKNDAKCGISKVHDVLERKIRESCFQINPQKYEKM